MSIGFRAEIHLDAKGMQALAKRERRVIRQAAMRAVTDVSYAARQALQDETQRAIPGRLRASRLHKGWRQKIYPKTSKSYRPAALILPDGGREGRTWKALQAFSEGASIRARKGQWLTIPTDKAVRSFRRAPRGERSPADWERRTGKKLRLIVPQGRDYLLLVTERRRRKPKAGAAPVRRRRRKRTAPKYDVIFILLKQTGIRRRFDMERVMAPYTALLVARYENIAAAVRHSQFLMAGGND